MKRQRNRPIPPSSFYMAEGSNKRIPKHEERSMRIFKKKQKDIRPPVPQIVEAMKARWEEDFTVESGTRDILYVNDKKTGLCIRVDTTYEKASCSGFNLTKDETQLIGKTVCDILEDQEEERREHMRDLFTERYNELSTNSN